MEVNYFAIRAVAQKIPVFGGAGDESPLVIDGFNNLLDMY